MEIYVELLDATGRLISNYTRDSDIPYMLPHTTTLIPELNEVHCLINGQNNVLKNVTFLVDRNRDDYNFKHSLVRNGYEFKCSLLFALANVRTIKVTAVDEIIESSRYSYLTVQKD